MLELLGVTAFARVSARRAEETPASTMAVTGGSSIDDGAAASHASSPVSLSPPSSGLICPGAVDVRSLRKRDFAMLELGGDAAAFRVSVRRMEEAPMFIIIPRWR